MLAGLEAAQSKVEQMVGFGKRRNSKTGELERMSTNAHQEARRLSTSRNSGPGSEAAKQEVRGIAAQQQQQQSQGSAVVDEPATRDMGATAGPRRNSIFGKIKLPTSPTKGPISPKA